MYGKFQNGQACLIQVQGTFHPIVNLLSELGIQVVFMCLNILKPLKELEFEAAFLSDYSIYCEEFKITVGPVVIPLFEYACWSLHPTVYFR